MRRISFVAVVFLALGYGGASQSREHLSTAVGQAKDRVVTSREVLLNEVLERLLGDGHGRGPIKLSQAIDSPQFAKQVSSLLLEWVVFFEARHMAVTQLSPEELAQARAKLNEWARGREDWQKLEFSRGEIDEAIERKLMAKKLIRFRADSSVIPISDSEVEKYFQQNRLKFGNMPIDNFRTSIKTFLSRQHVERRLKDWFEVLQAKYRTRNYLAEL